jgi:DNA-binding transcriptional LysR family regulator
LEAPEVELHALRLLLAIAEAGTLTQAAKGLHLSQPAATHQLAQLERALGVSLFERSARGLKATPAGQAATARAREALGSLAALREDLKALGSGTAGRLRVGAGASTLLQLLPPLLRDFRHGHPGVSFELKEGNTVRLAAWLEEAELDLAVVTLPLAAPGLAVEPWRADPLIPVGPARSPLAGHPLLPADLTRVPWLLPPEGTPLRQAALGGFHAAGLWPTVAAVMPSTEALKAAVEAGLGHAVLPQSAAAPALESGRMVALNTPPLWPARDLGLAWRAHHALSPAAQAFLEALRAQGRGGGA